MEKIENQEALCPICERKYIFGKDCPDNDNTCEHVVFGRGHVGGWFMEILPSFSIPETDDIRKERDAKYGDPAVSGDYIGKACHAALWTWWRRHTHGSIPAHVYWSLRLIEKIFRALYSDDPDFLEDTYKDMKRYAEMMEETDTQIRRTANEKAADNS